MSDKKKNIQLSHSAIEKYTSCGQLYKYHYIDKIRPITTGSPLVIGSVLDEVVTAMIEGKDYLTLFYALWSYHKFDRDKEAESLSDHILVRYSNKDYDERLLQDEDRLLLELKRKELNLPEGIDIIQVKKDKTYDGMSEEEVRLFNLANWLSLRNKIPYWLDEYKKVVIPRIKKIHSTQKKIELENSEGDTLIGFLDLDIDYLHDDGKIYRVIADNKTSSIKYKSDSVALSQQLTLYSISEGINYAVYFVINKTLKTIRNKKCETCGKYAKKDNTLLTKAKVCDSIINKVKCGGKWIQEIKFSASVDIIFDEITKEQQEKILDKVHQTTENIKNEIFEKNPKSCNNYGGCPYRKLCWEGKMDGLEKKK